MQVVCLHVCLFFLAGAGPTHSWPYSSLVPRHTPQVFKAVLRRASCTDCIILCTRVKQYKGEVV